MMHWWCLCMSPPVSRTKLSISIGKSDNLILTKKVPKWTQQSPWSSVIQSKCIQKSKCKKRQVVVLQEYMGNYFLARCSNFLGSCFYTWVFVWIEQTRYNVVSAPASYLHTFERYASRLWFVLSNPWWQCYLVLPINTPNFASEIKVNGKWKRCGRVDTTKKEVTHWWNDFKDRKCENKV